MIDYFGSGEQIIAPKVNIFDKKSITVWRNIRKITFDFGKQYFNKHIANTQVNFWVGCVCILGLWITYFISLDKNITTETKIKLLKMQFTFNMVAILLFIMYFANLALLVKLNTNTTDLIALLQLFAESLTQSDKAYSSENSQNPGS